MSIGNPLERCSSKPGQSLLKSRPVLLSCCPFPQELAERATAVEARRGWAPVGAPVGAALLADAERRNALGG